MAELIAYCVRPVKGKQKRLISPTNVGRCIVAFWSLTWGLISMPLIWRLTGTQNTGHPQGWAFLRATKERGKIRIEMNLERNSGSHFFIYFIVVSGSIYAVILNPTPWQLLHLHYLCVCTTTLKILQMKYISIIRTDKPKGLHHHSWNSGRSPSPSDWLKLFQVEFPYDLILSDVKHHPVQSTLYGAASVLSF